MIERCDYLTELSEDQRNYVYKNALRILSWIKLETIPQCQVWLVCGFVVTDQEQQHLHPILGVKHTVPWSSGWYIWFTERLSPEQEMGRWKMQAMVLGPPVRPHPCQTLSLGLSICVLIHRADKELTLPPSPSTPGRQAGEWRWPRLVPDQSTQMTFFQRSQNSAPCTTNQPPGRLLLMSFLQVIGRYADRRSPKGIKLFHIRVEGWKKKKELRGEQW